MEGMGSSVNTVSIDNAIKLGVATGRVGELMRLDPKHCFVRKTAGVQMLNVGNSLLLSAGKRAISLSSLTGKMCLLGASKIACGILE